MGSSRDHWEEYEEQLKLRALAEKLGVQRPPNLPSIAQQLAAAQMATARTSPLPQRSPLAITTPHGAIVICCETGRVSLPEGMPADVAASEFWKNLPSAFKQIMNDAINKRASEAFDLRWEEALKTRWPKLLSEECDRAYNKGFNEAVRILRK